MAEKTVAEKARIKPGATIAVLNRSTRGRRVSGAARGCHLRRAHDAQLVFLFVSTRAELEAQMPPAVAGLAPKAAIWVFHRKGSEAAGLDMGRDSIWAIAERLERAPPGLVSIDDAWSGRFRLRPAASASAEFAGSCGLSLSHKGRRCATPAVDQVWRPGRSAIRGPADRGGSDGRHCA